MIARRDDDPAGSNHRDERIRSAVTLQQWITGIIATGLVGMLAFLAGRDRKAIDEGFQESRRDRAEIRMIVTGHETRIQLMSQQVESIRNDYLALQAQNEELSKKLDNILREVKR